MRVVEAFDAVEQGHELRAEGAVRVGGHKLLVGGDGVPVDEEPEEGGRLDAGPPVGALGAGLGEDRGEGGGPGGEGGARGGEGGVRLEAKEGDFGGHFEGGLLVVGSDGWEVLRGWEGRNVFIL